MPFWIAHGLRARLRVPAGGLELGRAPSCTFISDDPRASRLHAIVHTDSDGARLLPLGRHGTLHNGRTVATPVALADGDTIAIPGLQLTVLASPDLAESAFVLAWEGGSTGLTRSPLTVGGGDDDIAIPGMEPATFRVYSGDGLYLEALRPVVLGERRAAPGELVAIPLGVPVRPAERGADGPSVSFHLAGGAPGPTPAIVQLGRLQSVQLTLAERGGGRLELGYEAGTVVLYLAERRADLVAALLSPSPGAEVQDEVMVRKVWGSIDAEPRLRINNLAWHTRRDLLAAGCPDADLIERHKLGHATRFRLDPATRVQVRSG